MQNYKYLRSWFIWWSIFGLVSWLLVHLLVTPNTQIGGQILETYFGFVGLCALGVIYVAEVQIPLMRDLSNGLDVLLCKSG